MENLDVHVLRHLAQWRAQGERALLATVVRTWGSSPRPIGSIMALGAWRFSAAIVLRQRASFRVCLLYTSPSPRD